MLTKSTNFFCGVKKCALLINNNNFSGFYMLQKQGELKVF